MPWLSFLDALRPDPGWRVDMAVVSTYSADCTAIVAAMLALAGRDDDRGSGSKVDFAEAYEQLKDRFYVVMQAGRLAVPRKRLPVLRLLDRIVLQMNVDERIRSWHAKVALLRLSSHDERYPQWRLWVSSRNLTRDMALDMGCLLVGSTRGEGSRLAGCDAVGRRLLERTPMGRDDIGRWCSELRRVGWHAPAGIVPLDIRVAEPDDRRGYPEIPPNAREIVVITPFVDAESVVHFGRCGHPNAQRMLVSTPAELARIGMLQDGLLAPYATVLQFDAPPPDHGDPGVPLAELPDASSDDEWRATGLHAKVVMARISNQWLAWVGSTNATARGWRRNFELVLALRLTPSVAVGIKKQLDIGTPFDATMLAATDPELDEIESSLDMARNRLLAEWVPGLRFVPKPSELHALRPPDLVESMTLRVGWLGGSRLPWGSASSSLALPCDLDEGDSELFEFELSLCGQRCEWVQRVPWDGELPLDRDQRVMARFLDHRTYMQWLKALLAQSGDAGDGGGDWDGNGAGPRAAHGRAAPSPSSWLPTLEEILRTSARQPATLREIDRRLDGYWSHLPSDIPDDERAALSELREVWRIVQRELLDPR